MALEGSERKILHAILREQGEALAGYVDDFKIAEIAYLSIEEVRDCLETLEAKDCVQRSLGVHGYSAYITAKGRQELRRSPVISGNDRGECALKIVPKGLRSFDAEDKDFFLELLPGPRRGDGLPESVHFWKVRIEEMDPDKTFRVGYIFGPSGCGKSSLVKAGLLPRLSKHIIPIYIEATGEETEARLLKGLRKHNPSLSSDLDLRTALVAVRDNIKAGSNKILLVIDQFEQWYHSRGAEPGTELARALTECDGARAQAIILVRDDYSMALHRFMAVIGVRQNQDQNFAVVDLFDLQHARKVLIAFGRGYGMLPDDPKEITGAQNEFLDRTIKALSQEGRVISVRLALFAEMLKGKPWTPETLKQVGGAEGVGVTFLEETFSARTAPPSYRIHEKAAQAVLRALLPEAGSNIKGNMRSHEELLEVSGYGSRPNEFDELLPILNNELRLISPIEQEGSDGDRQQRTQVGRKFFLLSHDYLVPSIREWLTRKQKETRRGRAELRLGERSSLWNAKPENRHLPSVLEWLNIRLLTKRREWSEPQRRMMKRAGRVHGVRGVLTLALLSAGVVAGIAFRRQFIENRRAVHAAGLVQRVLDAETAQVPDIVEAMRDYRQLVDSPLRTELAKESDDSPQKLHASLALLPVDATQVDYLFKRLIKATPSELPVLRDALKSHRTELTRKLWTILDSAKPDNASLLQAASALAKYDPDNAKWESVGSEVAQALVSVNSIYLGDWLKYLSGVRSKLTPLVATIFRDGKRSESEQAQATDILTNYARDDPILIADLLMDSDRQAYAAFFPIAQRQEAKVLPLFQAEISKKPTYSWDDPSLDPSWTTPDSTLSGKIESAQGILHERFAFCQTMPIDEFLTTVEALRKSGYRPVRLRPYADGQVVRVAAVWSRDGRNWRSASGLSPEQIRRQDEKNRNEKFLPIDVAAYVAIEKGGKPADRYAAVWVEKSGDDDARMYVGMTAEEQDEAPDKFNEAKLIPRTQNATVGSDGRTRYCGVLGRPPEGTITGQTYRDQFEGNFEQNQANLSDQLLIDIAVSEATKPTPIRERAHAELQSADKRQKTKPDDLDSRLARAMAYFRLGENQKALDDFQVVIGKNPEAVSAKQYRVIAFARLAKKQHAKSELEKFQKLDVPDHSKLYLSAVVAAELGEGAEKAFETLESALQKHSEDADLHYDAARAFSLASIAISRTDKVKGRQLAERCLQLLREVVKNDDADFGSMDGEGDLDPIRYDKAFAEIMKAGHPDRRYAAVWSSDASFEAIPIYGLDPAAHLQKCRELIAEGYRPVSLSLSRSTPEAPLLAASVWHRPTVQEEFKDRIAKRQARAVIALVRMGKTDRVWALLRHSPDPRLRSFIVNWLNPLAADPKLIAAELDRIDPNDKPTPAQRQQEMDAILFHPQTSQRRALILALGTYGTEGLSPSEREPLSGKLLDVYRSDPDSGIHGAAEWTLRKWGQQEKLKEVDAELSKLKERGNRRWFVNSQGQTFAVIEGPVEFRMGSPPTETERIAGNETPRRMRIPRRFAIAAKEVMVEQFQRFVKTNKEFGLPPSFVKKFSPDQDGPWIATAWYGAAAYCNWLSEQEGLPKDQWCYLKNEAGAYAEGMSIPADILDRTGYRLPTEAEWEYACRSGALTSRYYGNSLDLLDAYARYQANSKVHAWSCGSLLPNDLGLFDMLGNMYEWCQDSLNASRPRKKRMHDDLINISEYIIEKNPRLLRGGPFVDPPTTVRSANRFRLAPSSLNASYGFRPSRTYH